MHLGQFSYTNNASMGVFVIAIPHRCVADSCVISEAFDDQFYSSSGVGGEDEIPVFRIGIEESECAFPDRIYAMSCQSGWGGG